MKKPKKITLATLKYNALKLRANKQLPLYLCKLVQDLDGNEDIKYLNYLKSMSEHLLRIKGYYKKYPLEEKTAENLIRDGLKNLGFTR